MDEPEKKEILRSMKPDESVHGEPVDVVDIINKYGTYEIQPTADSDHDFPKIAQGLPSEGNRKLTDND